MVAGLDQCVCSSGRRSAASHSALTRCTAATASLVVRKLAMWNPPRARQRWAGASATSPEGGAADGNRSGGGRGTLLKMDTTVASNASAA
eukprot:scaffold14471_cov113-Isochrysis_galbana.AAC.8